MENFIDKNIPDSNQKFKALPDRIFYCLSSPMRLRIILVLSKGKMNVNQLSDIVNASQPEISAQLSILQNYGMVYGWRVGKEKYYKIIPESIESLTSWLDDIAISISVNNIPEFAPEAHLCSHALNRKCVNNIPEFDSHKQSRNGIRSYDHIAGKCGVMILKLLLSMKWIIVKNDTPEYELTDLGEIMLINSGVNIPVRKKHGRIFAYGCMDLTEKEYHLGGSLGSEIMKTLMNQNYIKIYKNTRVIDIIKPIKPWFGIDYTGK